MRAHLIVISGIPREHTAQVALLIHQIVFSLGGAGESEIMAVTGYTTSKEVIRYTRGARQKVLAAKAIARFDENKIEQNYPTFPKRGKRRGNFTWGLII
jgi:hypothetical protein